MFCTINDITTVSGKLIYEIHHIEIMYEKTLHFSSRRKCDADPIVQAQQDKRRILFTLQRANKTNLFHKMNYSNHHKRNLLGLNNRKDDDNKIVKDYNMMLNLKKRVDPTVFCKKENKNELDDLQSLYGVGNEKNVIGEKNEKQQFDDVAMNEYMRKRGREKMMIIDVNEVMIQPSKLLNDINDGDEKEYTKKRDEIKDKNKTELTSVLNSTSCLLALSCKHKKRKLIPRRFFVGCVDCDNINGCCACSLRERNQSIRTLRDFVGEKYKKKKCKICACVKLTIDDVCNHGNQLNDIDGVDGEIADLCLNAIDDYGPACMIIWPPTLSMQVMTKKKRIDMMDGMRNDHVDGKFVAVRNRYDAHHLMTKIDDIHEFEHTSLIKHGLKHWRAISSPYVELVNERIGCRSPFRRYQFRLFRRLQRTFNIGVWLSQQSLCHYACYLTATRSFMASVETMFMIRGLSLDDVIDDIIRPLLCVVVGFERRVYLKHIGYVYRKDFFVLMVYLLRSLLLCLFMCLPMNERLLLMQLLLIMDFERYQLMNFSFLCLIEFMCSVAVFRVRESKFGQNFMTNLGADDHLSQPGYIYDLLLLLRNFSTLYCEFINIDCFFSLVQSMKDFFSKIVYAYENGLKLMAVGVIEVTLGRDLLLGYHGVGLCRGVDDTLLPMLLELRRTDVMICYHLLCYGSVQRCDFVSVEIIDDEVVGYYLITIAHVEDLDVDTGLIDHELTLYQLQTVVDCCRLIVERVYDYPTSQLHQLMKLNDLIECGTRYECKQLTELDYLQFLLLSRHTTRFFSHLMLYVRVGKMNRFQDQIRLLRASYHTSNIHRFRTEFVCRASEFIEYISDWYWVFHALSSNVVLLRQYLRRIMSVMYGTRRRFGLFCKKNFFYSVRDMNKYLIAFQTVFKQVMEMTLTACSMSSDEACDHVELIPWFNCVVSSLLCGYQTTVFFGLTGISISKLMKMVNGNISQSILSEYVYFLVYTVYVRLFTISHLVAVKTYMMCPTTGHQTMVFSQIPLILHEVSTKKGKMYCYPRFSDERFPEVAIHAHDLSRYITEEGERLMSVRVTDGQYMLPPLAKNIEYEYDDDSFEYFEHMLQTDMLELLSNAAALSGKMTVPVMFYQISQLVMPYHECTDDDMFFYLRKMGKKYVRKRFWMTGINCAMDDFSYSDNDVLAVIDWTFQFLFEKHVDKLISVLKEPVFSKYHDMIYHNDQGFYVCSNIVDDGWKIPELVAMANISVVSEAAEVDEQIDVPMTSEVEVATVATSTASPTTPGRHKIYAPTTLPSILQTVYTSTLTALTSSTTAKPVDVPIQVDSEPDTVIPIVSAMFDDAFFNNDTHMNMFGNYADNVIGGIRQYATTVPFDRKGCGYLIRTASLVLLANERLGISSRAKRALRCSRSLTNSTSAEAAVLRMLALEDTFSYDPITRVFTLKNIVKIDVGSIVDPKVAFFLTSSVSRYIRALLTASILNGERLGSDLTLDAMFEVTGSGLDLLNSIVQPPHTKEYSGAITRVLDRERFRVPVKHVEQYGREQFEDIVLSDFIGNAMKKFECEDVYDVRNYRYCFVAEFMNKYELEHELQLVFGTHLTPSYLRNSVYADYRTIILKLVLARTAYVLPTSEPTVVQFDRLIEMCQGSEVSLFKALHGPLTLRRYIPVLVVAHEMNVFDQLVRTSSLPHIRLIENIRSWYPYSPLIVTTNTGLVRNAEYSICYKLDRYQFELRKHSVDFGTMDFTIYEVALSQCNLVIPIDTISANRMVQYVSDIPRRFHDILGL